MKKSILGTNDIPFEPTDGQVGCGIAAFGIMGLFGSIGSVGLIFADSVHDRNAAAVVLGTAVIMSGLTLLLSASFASYQYHHPDTVETLQSSSGVLLIIN